MGGVTRLTISLAVIMMEVRVDLICVCSSVPASTSSYGRNGFSAVKLSEAIWPMPAYASSFCNAKAY